MAADKSTLASPEIETPLGTLIASDCRGQLSRKLRQCQFRSIL
jgi:hypothetical protein